MRARGAIAAAASVWLGACARFPLNAPLEQFDPAHGYRVAATSGDLDDSQQLLLIVNFSGGGTRAAAFAYGALQALAEAKVRFDGRERALADEGYFLRRAELPLERRRPVVDGRGFEFGEIGDIDPAVADAAGDHDRASADAFSVGELQLESCRFSRRAASQAHDLVWDRHLGTELLRLVERASHQRHAGDSGRKAGGATP